MNDKQITQCINAAEMGLTQEQASELLEIPHGLVQALTKEFNIQFSCLRRKANERRSSKLKSRESNSTGAPFIEAYGGRSSNRQQATPRSKATRTRSTNTNNTEKLDYKTLEKLIASGKTKQQKFEIGYSYIFKELRQREHNTTKGPKIPVQKIHSVATASSRSIKEQRQQSLIKRKVIMDCFTNGQTMYAEDVSSITGNNIRSSSQMLDLMYRDGTLHRERIQFSHRKKDSVYLYSKP